MATVSFSTPNGLSEPLSRAALRNARRVLIKAGTSVVANSDGSPSLTRLGAITEQIAELSHAGVEIIFVSSGAVGMGKNLLQKQARLGLSFNDLQNPDISTNGTSPAKLPIDAVSGRSGLTSGDSLTDLLEANDHLLTSQSRSFAAAGQHSMMSLYEHLMAPLNLTASQILLTQQDFWNENHVKSLQYAIDRLLSLNIIPIINENDAVSIVQDDREQESKFSDNDSLAALCARTFGAEVCVLLTDVEGVFNMPPDRPGAKLIPFHKSDSEVAIGNKSTQGRGGMAAKIAAAQKAVELGSPCTACVVAAGSDLNSVRSILAREHDPSLGPPKGTLFTQPGSDLEKLAMEEFSSMADDQESCFEQAKDMATVARNEARKLQSLPHDERKATLLAVADALVENKERILKANAKDLEQATIDKVDNQLMKRLKLTDEKMRTLSEGIRQVAEQKDPLGVVKQKRELAEGLELSLITVPIGVLMIIFESRPDSLPQIASLAIASGNGLLLKGGKEAFHSNVTLHKVIGEAIEKGSKGKISRELIALVTSRGQVKDLLKLDDVIDLVIPRGSNSLVSYIKGNTRIPVLGHADGVCHVYIDSSASADNASKIAVDAKTDYPSACNAMETLLLHRDTVANGVASQVLMALRSEGVKCLGGPEAMSAGLCDVASEQTKCEYGDLTCQVEIVDNVDQAIEWIHANGSGHTEVIVCETGNPVAEEFLRRVDAACVFANVSSRFADGFRLGLGAEVGISTGRIHARGPVGVDGLLTTKWQLRSAGGVHYASEFAGESASKHFTHKELM